MAELGGDCLPVTGLFRRAPGLRREYTYVRQNQRKSIRKPAVGSAEQDLIGTATHIVPGMDHSAIAAQQKLNQSAYHEVAARVTNPASIRYAGGHQRSRSTCRTSDIRHRGFVRV